MPAGTVPWDLDNRLRVALVTRVMVHVFKGAVTCCVFHPVFVVVEHSAASTCDSADCMADFFVRLPIMGAIKHLPVLEGTIQEGYSRSPGACAVGIESACRSPLGDPVGHSPPNRNDAAESS